MSTAVSTITYKVPKRRHPVVLFMTQQPLGAAGFVIILATGVCAAFAQWVAPYDPLAVDYGAMLAAPSGDHWLGTDSFGRDVLSRIIYGARTALAIGFIASFLGSTAGAVIGVVSAYFGGKTDLIIQGVMDVLLSFPIIVLAITVVAVLGNYVVLGLDINLIIAIAIPMLPRVERVVRASALAVRELPYVDAARAAGYSHARIIFRHMVPNVVAPYLIMLTAFVAQANGQRLTFSTANADATALVDKETGSRWSPYGECTSGKLKGSKLEMLVLEPEYWFAWSEFHRSTAIYAPAGKSAR